MPKPPPYTERDRRPPEVRVRDELLRDLGPLVGRPGQFQDDVSREWVEGFMAGVTAANLARGTRDLVAPDEEPTAPYPVVDPES